jgi:hypothetical protein
MREFPKPLASFMAILSAFTLGGYVTQEFMFNQPVELSRYVMTFVFGFMFYLYGKKDS